MNKFNFLILCFLNFNISASNDFALDATFNKIGKVITNVGNQNNSQGTAILVQNDDKILIAGQAAKQNGVLHFALVRYNTDGTIDTSFNSSGSQPGMIILNQFDGPKFSLAFDALIQKDQKIVLAGQVNRVFGVDDDNNFGLARFNNNGSVDTSFGNNGTVSTNISGAISDDAINGIVLQNDQKIVAAGGVELKAHVSNSKTALARYNTDGSLDTTYNPSGTGSGQPGIVVIDISGTGAFNRANSATIQPDQKVVITGISGDSYVLARFNIDGSLDSTFNSSGQMPGVVIDVYKSGNFANKGNGIDIQPDGKIIIAGKLVNNITGIAQAGLARYNSDGTLDSTFGKNGKAIFDINFFTVNCALQPDGKIILIGSFDSANLQKHKFALLRVNQNGTLDKSFGNNGLFVIKDFFGFRMSGGAEVKIDSKGRIVAAGEVDFDNNKSQFAGVRLTECSIVADNLTLDIRKKYQ